MIVDEIFRAYDIRGVVDKSLTNEAVIAIGKAIGSSIIEYGSDRVVVGRDGRLSGPGLRDSLCSGILSTGCNVIDIGQVPTPIVYFASKFLDVDAAVMITGSHNPADYNGLKIILEDKTIYGEQIQGLYKRIKANNFIVGKGELISRDVSVEYLNAVQAKAKLQKKLKIVLDCGNGVPSELAPKLFRSMGCEVIELFCEIDGTFPNHHPDPSVPANLQDLQQVVIEHNADLGLALDGDGDRLGIVDSKGKIIWPDRAIMIFIEELLQRKPGSTIIYDIKCCRDLKHLILKKSGKPLMWKTGHSLIKAKMLETGAELATEMSGHIFIKDNWYGFDDALYAGARLLELLSREKLNSSEVFARFPEQISTPEMSLDVTEKSKFEIIEQLKNTKYFADADEIVTIDGLRVEYPTGWGLIRPSNTTPKLVFRCEAQSIEELNIIKSKFQAALNDVASEWGFAL